MVLWLERAEGTVRMGHQALVEWDWGWHRRRDLRQGDGALQKCWAIYPEEIIIVALFTIVRT